MMEDENDGVASLEGDFLAGRWDCDGCPPPFFNLPPPPRPPFLEDVTLPGHAAAASEEERAEFCLRNSNPYDTCDNPLIVDTRLRGASDVGSVFLEGEALNILVIVVCACLLVALILAVAFVIWR